MSGRRYFDGEPWDAPRAWRQRKFRGLEYDNHCLCNFAATTAAIIAGSLAAAGAIGGSAISAHAASSAANTQMTAAEKIAADAKTQAATATDTVNKATDTANAGLTDALATANAGLTDAQKQQLEALKPYIDAGSVSMSDLQQLLGTNGPLASPGGQFSFTAKDWQNDPGFEFTKSTAETGLNRQLAAAGGLLGGGADKANARLDTGLASTHLSESFQRALQIYDTNRQNVLTRIQGLTGLTNLGYSATGVQNQDIGNTSQLVAANTENTASRVAANKIAAGEYAGNTGLTAAQIAAQAEAGGAAAKGAGDIGVGNAINTGISGVIKGANTALGIKPPPIVYSIPGVQTTGNSKEANA